MLRRLGLAISLGVLAVLCAVLPASAGWTWCRTDPIVRLNGTQYQIIVSVPVDYVPVVTGATQVVVSVPDDVDRALVSTDAGFNGYGESVSFGHLSRQDGELGRFPVNIRVTIPINLAQLGLGQAVPVRVVVKLDSTVIAVVTGTADGTVLSFSL